MNTATISPSRTLAPSHHFVGAISELCWSPDGLRLAAASDGGSVAVWETRTGRCVFERRIGRLPITALAWTRHCRCLLLGNVSGTLSLLDLSSGELVTSASFQHPITRIASSPNEDAACFFVVAGPLVRIFTAHRAHATTRRYPTPIVDASWCPAGRSLAILTRHGLVEVWDSAEKRVRLQRVLPQARCLAWDKTDQTLMVGTEQGAIQTYSLRHECWEEVQAVSRFPLAALVQGEHGIVAHCERETLFWDACAWHTLTSSILALALDPCGALLATADARAVTVAALA